MAADAVVVVVVGGGGGGVVVCVVVVVVGGDGGVGVVFVVAVVVAAAAAVVVVQPGTQTLNRGCKFHAPGPRTAAWDRRLGPPLPQPKESRPRRILAQAQSEARWRQKA